MPEAYRPQIVDFAAHGVTVLEGITYTADDGNPLLMDCFYLESTPAPRPVIVWIHGGGFILEENTRLSRPEKSFLALVQRGYLVVSIDYRLSYEEPFPSQMYDANCAVRFLRAHAEQLQLNPDKIAVWGESCGGQMAGLMAVMDGIAEFEGERGWNEYSSRIAAAVSWYGGFDISSFTQLLNDPVFPVLYGGTYEEKKDLIYRASPSTYVGQKLCPFLAMCSDTDDHVPDSQSLAFCEAAKAHGNDAEYIMVPGQGHGYFEGDEYYEAVYSFFDKHLK